MKDRAKELEREGDTLRSAGTLDSAGRQYTLAAHEYAGDTKLVFPEPGSQELVLRALLKSATCYRIAGNAFRTQNRCEMGILIASDHVNYIEDVGFEPGSFADLRRGAWPEFIGDFRTIAQCENADEAYDRAKTIYEGAGDFEFVTAEQEHMALTIYFRSIREGLGHSISRQDPEERPPEITFSEWVEYKRDRLPDPLDQLAEQGEWPANDGTC